MQPVHLLDRRHPDGPELLRRADQDISVSVAALALRSVSSLSCGNVSVVQLTGNTGRLPAGMAASAKLRRLGGSRAVRRVWDGKVVDRGVGGPGGHETADAAACRVIACTGPDLGWPARRGMRASGHGESGAVAGHAGKMNQAQAVVIVAAETQPLSQHPAKGCFYRDIYPQRPGGRGLTPPQPDRPDSPDHELGEHVL
jgi:hypothetical protein